MTKNNLSKSGFDMLCFEHEAVARLTSALNEKLRQANDLQDFEREYWSQRIDQLMKLCEADGEIIVNSNNYKSLKAKLN